MANEKGENSYRSILRGISIFGGTQILHVLISLVRGKFVAILLGPAGMGINSLYTTASEMIQQFASFGLNLAFVKEISSVKDNPERVKEVFAVAKRMLYITALIGALICFCGASLFSNLTFGNSNHIYGMMLLSAVVFLTIAWKGEMSVLQGLHRVNLLSKASIVGSLAGLCLGVPLLWLFGTRGIVPSMLAFAVVMLIFYARGVRKTLGKGTVQFVWSSHKSLVKKLLMMGFVFMSTDIFASAFSYLLDVYIRWSGELASVGLWRAAYSLSMQYAGVIFSALTLDYFPRLSAAIGRNKSFRHIVNRQTEIVSLVILPLCCLLMIFAPLVVRLLLDKSFIVVIPLLRVFAMALIVRGVMFPLGYVILAKGDKKLYFWLEGVGANILTYGLIALGFTLFGIIGIGFAMLTDNLIFVAVYMFVNRKLYGFRFSMKALSCGLWAIVVGGLCLASSWMQNEILSYGVMSVLTLVSLFTGIRGLRIRMKRNTPSS